MVLYYSYITSSFMSFETPPGVNERPFHTTLIIVGYGSYGYRVYGMYVGRYRRAGTCMVSSVTLPLVLVSDVVIVKLNQIINYHILK